MGILGAKCPHCWDRYEYCTCPDNPTKQPLGQAIGRIAPIRAYQTSDGRKFTGPGALEDAQDHQRWLDRQEAAKPRKPRKKPLKRIKPKRKVLS